MKFCKNRKFLTKKNFVEYRELSLNIANEFFIKLSSILTKVVGFNNIYLEYFIILQNLTRNYEILQKFM